MIHPERVRELNDLPERGGRYVLYWMQQSQRVATNHALELAVERANARSEPLVVGFGLTDGYPDANVRHYRFLLEGLADVASQLARRGIAFALRRGSPDDVALGLASEASLVVCDGAWLRHQRAWRDRVAREAGCRVLEVETDVVVPVSTASEKAEFAARTIRPKLERNRRRFLVELRPQRLVRDSLDVDPSGDASALDITDRAQIDVLLDRLAIDRDVPPVSDHYRGGTGAACRRLRYFVDELLPGYAASRSRPEEGRVSSLSPYLHFGHVSPIDIAGAVIEAPHGSNDDKDSFLEELLIRRELAWNWVRYTRDYDDYRCLPDWAQQTLREHEGDERENVYTRRELEEAKTDDPYWNAAMRAMRLTGYLHNRMRMYWGKRILAWVRSPRYAYKVALDLNNRWFLDGRDPSSYANIGWIFGLHDRPFQERPIYGKVRTLTAGGLDRKGDIERWLESVEKLEAGRGERT